jgi:hypothetical protein
VSTLELIAETSETVTDAYGNTEAAAEAAKARVEDLSTAWQNAAIDASDYWVDSEDGAKAFDWQQYLADAEFTLAQANDYKRRIVTMPPEIAAEGERVFAEQGAHAANTFLSAYEGASTEDKARFSAAARANGEATGTAAAEGIVSGFGSPTLEATAEVDPKPAKDTYQGMLDHFEKAKKPKTVVTADTSTADQAIVQSQMLASKPLTIKVKADMSDFDYAIRNYKPPSVYIPGVVVKPGTRQPI